MSEEKKEVKQEGDFKIKKKPSMKKLGKQPEVIKVDLSAKKAEESEVTKVVIPSSEEKKDANTEQEATNLVADKQAETVQEVEAEVSPGEGSIQDDGFSAIQEITEEDISETTEEVVSAIKESEETGKPLPENIEKLEQALWEILKDTKVEDTENDWPRIFHTRLASSTQNPVYSAIAELLWEQTRGPLFENFRTHTKMRENQPVSQDHRSELVNCLKQKDASGARRAMHHHIDAVGDILTHLDMT